MKIWFVHGAESPAGSGESFESENPQNIIYGDSEVILTLNLDSLEYLEQNFGEVAVKEAIRDIIFNCIHSNLYEFKKIINKYAINIQGFQVGGATLLHFSSLRKRDLEVPKYLLSQKLKIDARDDNGATALHWACRDHNLGLVEYLLNQKANLESKDNNNSTPLHWAYTYKAYSVIKKLKEYNANEQLINADGLKPAQMKPIGGICCIIL